MSTVLSEIEFRNYADEAIGALKKHLFATEEEGGFEVEEQGGVLNVVFEEPAGKFVVTPNAPVRQIWISALSTSFKLDWSVEEGAFVLPKSGEKLIELVDRVIQEHLES
jgi:CyaY protein